MARVPMLEVWRPAASSAAAHGGGPHDAARAVVVRWWGAGLAPCAAGVLRHRLRRRRSRAPAALAEFLFLTELKIEDVSSLWLLTHGGLPLLAVSRRGPAWRSPCFACWYIGSRAKAFHVSVMMVPVGIIFLVEGITVRTSI